MSEDLKLKPLPLEEQVQTDKEKSEKKKLVPLYLLLFEIPSENLSIISTEYEIEEDKKLITVIHRLDQELRRKLVNLRIDFNYHRDKLFATSLLGWLTTSEEGIKFAEEWNEKFKNALKTFAETIVKKKIMETSDEKLKQLYSKLYDKLIRRAERQIVKAIKIYLEPKDAKEILNDIVTKLNDDILELKKRISEVEKEQEKSKLYRLNSMLLTLEFKRDMFDKVLKTLE